LTETNFTDSTSWTAEEEVIVARIMATETQHDPENYTSDRRIACTRAEALRRLQRRKQHGVYRAPTGIALASATLPVIADTTPARLAAIANARNFRKTSLIPVEA
jgi:hypothetical protein